MTKKQKNRKVVSQNLRNKIANRRYTSLIKFFLKSLKAKIAILKKKTTLEKTEQIEILNLEQKLESVLDKSVKRNVFHKNKVARNKSRIHKFIQKEFAKLSLIS